MKSEIMQMSNLKLLATHFRAAIDKALSVGEFDKDLSFRQFPRACCGDTSDLLAQYLLDNGIKTYYVCGNYYFDDVTMNAQSHAWLWTADKTIIDITGDQFKYDSTFLNYDIPVYVGREDKFHKLYEVRAMNVRECLGISELGSMCQPRLRFLYQIIRRHIVDL